MLTDKKIKGKLDRLLKSYEPLVYYPVADVPVRMAETAEHLRTVPGDDALPWQEATPGTAWGCAWNNAWFKGRATMPAACDGREVYVCAKTGGVETLLFVNGMPAGLLNSFAAGEPGRPHHAVRRVAAVGQTGRELELGFEVYAGHPCVGSDPAGKTEADVNTPALYRHEFRGVQLVLCRDDVRRFYFDLRTLLSLVDALDEHSLRRNRIMAALGDVYAVVHQLPSEMPELTWRPALTEAQAILTPLMQTHNAATIPLIGLTGHSHMDTAWLWPVNETIRKCARTFSTALAMLEQYPPYRFLQSAPCHADFMRREYPELFERMRRAVAGGRWEPNGGMWVEPDCNLPSGESFVRQFLFGQAFTRRWFDGYRADAYWQPDVFGYSAALPQIMRGCGIKYFLTTKLSWNDTNRFPYETFRWRGIDGSEVIAHFNCIHCYPEPKTLTDQWRGVQHKDVEDRRLCAYGFGDGGGGPQDEMLELAMRVEDLEGCPRTRHVSVSEFMDGVARELGPRLPAWSGELYLELHRGTLTSIHGIKRGNRKAEFALREAEFAATLARLTARDTNYPADRLDALWRTLLMNQFHDILPGSSITEVNRQAVEELEACRAEATSLARTALAAMVGESADCTGVVVANSLSWTRDEELVLADIPDGQEPTGGGITSQSVTDVEGQRRVAVTGLTLPPLGAAFVPLADEPPIPGGASPFRVGEDAETVETPFACVCFDARGHIVGFYDKQARRELVREDGAFNRLLVGEDVPAAWDNWDVDYDQRFKMRDGAECLSRRVVADGPLQLRLRFRYAIGTHSLMVQDVVFHATTPRVDFETLVEWRERHVLLQTAFETPLMADSARHEIQFGHLTRATHENRPAERAQFEVCNHKWTDLSESRYGVALLNDCKYAITVRDGAMRLTLLKSGTHPDHRGDPGSHRFDYALLPHKGAFAAENVIRPAYAFNVSPTVVPGGTPASPVSLATVSAPNVVVETVKWAEDGDGFVLRLYEAERNGTHCDVTFGVPVRRVAETTMLEEAPVNVALRDGGVELHFRPFEIKTLRVWA